MLNKSTPCLIVENLGKRLCLGFSNIIKNSLPCCICLTRALGHLSSPSSVTVEWTPGLPSVKNMRKGAVTSTACAFNSWLQVLMAKKTSQIKLDARLTLLIMVHCLLPETFQHLLKPPQWKKWKRSFWFKITPLDIPDVASSRVMFSHLWGPNKGQCKTRCQLCLRTSPLTTEHMLLG